MLSTKAKLRQLTRFVTNPVTQCAKNRRAPSICTAVVLYAIIEFFAVASSSYFGTALYHFIGRHSWQTTPAYIVAAVVIAMLVLLSSVGFRNFVAFRSQSRHIFLWRGIGAVALAFSIFVTILFFTQFAEAYSRGSLIFQIIAWYCGYKRTRHILFLASNCNRFKSNRSSTRCSYWQRLSLF